MRAPFCLPCVFVVFFVLLSYSSSAYVILSLAENTTLVSPRKVFELGFFNHAFISSRWYLGIWYRNDPNRTHLWVANSKPLVGSNETLRLWENNLFLVNQDNSTVWSTNLTGRGVRASQTVAVLLDNGNFVLKDPNNINNNPDDFLWQSFDSPTDTLLPEMKLGFDPKNGIEKFLTSWDSSYSPVFYTFKLKNQSGLFELFVCDTETSHCHYRSDPWDGIRFDDNLPLEQASNTTFLMTGSNVNSRLTLSDWGSLEAYTWAEEKMELYTTWSSDVDKCNAYRTCPTYSYCSSPTKKDARSECPCFKGFDPMVEEQSQAYCRRRTKLSCRGDGFLHLNNMKLPDTKNVSVNMELDFQNCKESCLRECECTAFAYVSIGKGQLGCVRWSGDLNDMRKYTLGGKDLYVRLAAKDLPGLEDSGKNIGQIVGYVIAGLVVIVSLVIFCYWKKHKRRIQERRRSTESEIAMNEIVRPESFQLMDFGVIAQATDNFSEGNKLGQGGFGSVFKGTLPDGKEVAVKRLKARSSQSQGITEFNNEVTMILRVLHVNLVRLLGCCSEGDEKILVYEYHGNSSLNRYLFDKTQSSLLNWAQRYKIMKGIAEGLSYLHYFTSPPILHRDLKPSNILLDKDMIPKISDFGLAQMLEIGTTEAETERAVGTYGYMPEEYALHHIMSEKSDIFSYGVLLLETVTGKRNVDYCNRNPGDSLLDYVWRMWDEGNDLTVIDSNFYDSSFVENQVLRSIKIGLSCVQQDPYDRPNIKSVVLMLESTETEIPRPTPPNYYYGRFLIGESSSLGGQSTTIQSSINYVTLSKQDPR